jgi:hypothetical protein
MRPDSEVPGLTTGKREHQSVDRPSATWGLLPLMLPVRGDACILCADLSAERLGSLAMRLASEGWELVCTHSAAQCLAKAAERRPRVIVLDSEFFCVDLENIPEYISQISGASSVVLMVEDPLLWQQPTPKFVDAVIRRGDLDALVTFLRKIS